MRFHLRTHRPEDCWRATGGTASELVARIEGTEDPFGVSVRSACVVPNGHTFDPAVESDTFEAMTGLSGPPLLQDYGAAGVPVATLTEVMDALDVG